jgi:hypothetical protein
MIQLQPQITRLPLADLIFPMNLLHFDSQKLIALGVPPEDAKSIAQTIITKHTMLRYWRRLAQAGIPSDNARRIARAIAKYDVIQTLPSARQQNLIRYYCPIVCRCGLWRSALLLSQPSKLTPVS